MTLKFLRWFSAKKDILVSVLIVIISHWLFPFFKLKQLYFFRSDFSICKIKVSHWVEYSGSFYRIVFLDLSFVVKPVSERRMKITLIVLVKFFEFVSINVSDSNLYLSEDLSDIDNSSGKVLRFSFRNFIFKLLKWKWTKKKKQKQRQNTKIKLNDLVIALIFDGKNYKFTELHTDLQKLRNSYSFAVLIYEI